ncbi:hypothetical protein FC093_16545 [Ilyomonas limi]|uniref:Uncharacterized protein n=1 Tax=Ilyomonas limi TaxID=2575867 RepID=A0A4U3KVN0_9BACT|nr:hypothetical protein [Ilyomonas limi]TKK66645.1 hypothetical protein FC093_16545 [Ilyomonas limi]
MIPFVIIAVVIVRVIISACKIAESNKTVARRFRKLRISSGKSLIANNFVDSKHLFIKLNKQLPNVMLINGIDVSQAVKLLEAKLNSSIKTVYKHKQFDFDEQQIVFNMMIIVTSDNRIIEVGNSYVELLYTAEHALWADYLANELAAFQLCSTATSFSKTVCVRGLPAGRTKN